MASDGSKRGGAEWQESGFEERENGEATMAGRRQGETEGDSDRIAEERPCRKGTCRKGTRRKGKRKSGHRPLTRSGLGDADQRPGPRRGAKRSRRSGRSEQRDSGSRHPFQGAKGTGDSMLAAPPCQTAVGALPSGHSGAPKGERRGRPRREPRRTAPVPPAGGAEPRLRRFRTSAATAVGGRTPGGDRQESSGGSGRSRAAGAERTAVGVPGFDRPRGGRRPPYGRRPTGKTCGEGLRGRPAAKIYGEDG